MLHAGREEYNVLIIRLDKEKTTLLTTEVDTTAVEIV